MGGCRSMRSLAPLYLHSFESSQPLRDRWLRADTMAQWHDAAAAGSYDADEAFPAAGLRHARLKGGGEPTTQRVALPAGATARLERIARSTPAAGWYSQRACTVVGSGSALLTTD